MILLHTLAPFLLGFGGILLMGAVIRVLVGLRLKLYLISRDAGMIDQALIPITAETKKQSFWLALSKGEWREDVILELRDYQDHKFHFNIGYGVWRRFFFQLNSAEASVAINKREVKGHKKYSLRTGDRLRIGDREFEALVTPSRQIHEHFQHDFLY